MSRIPDPPPFQTEISVLHGELESYPLDRVRLFAATEVVDSDEAARKVAGRIVAAGRSMRAGPRHVIQVGADRPAYGARLRVPLSMRREAWKLVLAFHGLDKRPPAYARQALAYATGMDGVFGRRDRLDGLIQVMADCRRRGLTMSFPRMMTRAWLGTPLSVQQGPMSRRQVQNVWQEHGEVLEERIGQYVVFHDEAEAKRLVAGSPEWADLLRDTVDHERDDLSCEDIPVVVAGLASEDPHHRAIGAHCACLLLFRPDVAEYWDKALVLAAAALAGEV